MVVLQFNSVVEVLESNNDITIRHMNPGGDYFHSSTDQIEYSDDSLSFNLGDSYSDNNSDGDDLQFEDAVMDEDFNVDGLDTYAFDR
jgi:hypothetical protein